MKRTCQPSMKVQGESKKELYKLFTFNCIACEFHITLN